MIFFKLLKQVQPVLSVFLQVLFLLSISSDVNGQLDTTNCGVVDTKGVKVVNGIPMLTQYPWFASFYRPQGLEPMDKIIVDCEGSLVTKRHVITAGHCYKGIPEPKRAAYFNVAFDMKDRCTGPRKEALVSSVVVHGLYKDNWGVTPQNDAAIVVLQSDVDNTPICLPSLNNYDGIFATTIGFGSTTADPSNPEFSCELLSAILYINSRELLNCLTTNYFPEILPFPTICAHNPGYKVDPCFADSGGPLMVYNNGRFELVGFLSYGKVCAGDHWPKIYTDATNFGQGQWIKEQIFGSVSNWSPPPVPETTTQR